MTCVKEARPAEGLVVCEDGYPPGSAAPSAEKDGLYIVREAFLAEGLVGRGLLSSHSRRVLSRGGEPSRRELGGYQDDIS